MDDQVIELRRRLKQMTRSRNAYRGLYRRQKRISRGFCEMALFMARENLEIDKDKDREQPQLVEMSDDEYETSSTSEDDDEMIDMADFEQNIRREEYLRN